MADAPTITPPAAPPVVPPAAPPVAPPVSPPESGDEGRGSKEAVLADLARERDKRQALEAQIADIEKSKLGEKERAEVERDEARKEAAEAKTALARMTVGAKYGLTPDDLADLRTDGTPEEFDARAKRLSERLKTAPGVKPGGGLPPSPNAGREASKLSGAEMGLAEAERRFGKKS